MAATPSKSESEQDYNAGYEDSDTQQRKLDEAPKISPSSRQVEPGKKVIAVVPDSSSAPEPIYDTSKDAPAEYNAGTDPEAANELTQRADRRQAERDAEARDKALDQRMKELDAAADKEMAQRTSKRSGRVDESTTAAGKR